MVFSAGPSIPGLFNYEDPALYTFTEALDILNSVLIPKKYILVRQGKSSTSTALRRLCIPSMCRPFQPRIFGIVGETS